MLSFLLCSHALLAAVQDLPKDWPHWVRLCGNGIGLGRAELVVKAAVDSGCYGLEVDNDPTGRYDSFLDPSRKLEELRQAAAAAHRSHNPVFAYLAGTECITANADISAHSVMKDHPDWAQQDKTGRKAVFGGGTAFWIEKGDEDVWISPFAPEWRKRYMAIVRQMAATGIDGVYVDVPYWMTHFDGWDKTWASFDKYTLAAFRAKTGLNALTQVKLGDYTDSAFRKWIRFRIDAITDFLAEIRLNVQAVNPKCLTIPEIFPGYDSEAGVVGSDVYRLYKTCDLVCHEYNPGDRSAERTNADWYSYLVGMETFRAFAGGKPTWMLAYSWSGEAEPKPDDAMENLACANVLAGTNMWDASRMVMSGSNDIRERKKIYDWIRDNQAMIYSPRTPLGPVGVYFSPESRDYTPETFVDAYTRQVSNLLNDHVEFQIVTPDTLSGFKGRDLYLPEVRCISNDELAGLATLHAKGVMLHSSGSFAVADENGDPADGDRGRRLGIAGGLKLLPTEASAGATSVTVLAPSTVVAHIASVNGRPTVWFANWTGLGPKESGAPVPQEGIRIGFPEGIHGRVVEIPFLGKESVLNTTEKDGRMWCILPTLYKGAIVYLNLDKP
jgi:hypothetical protein